VQEELWEEKGQNPRSQQVPSLARLRKGLPLYETFLELGSVEQVLEEFQRKGLPQRDLEDKTALGVIKDLQDLLVPRLEGA